MKRRKKNLLGTRQTGGTLKSPSRRFTDCSDGREYKGRGCREEKSTNKFQGETDIGPFPGGEKLSKGRKRNHFYTRAFSKKKKSTYPNATNITYFKNRLETHNNPGSSSHVKKINFGKVLKVPPVVRTRRAPLPGWE